MEKLIITCCTNDPVFFRNIKGLHMPMTVREVADSARAARDAGASIVHVHEPFDAKFKGPMGYNTDAWLEVIQLIRQETDLIFEHGIGGHPYIYPEFFTPEVPEEIRKKAPPIKVEHPDFIATLLGSIHHPFGGTRGIYVMPTREDFEKWSKIMREGGVRPSFESWHIGDYYNLQWVDNKKLFDRPYWITLFLGAECGVGSPPTLDELIHRVKYLPEYAVWQLSVWCSIKGAATSKQQLALFAQAITMGGHVRLGMEDNPYYWDGVPAESNAQLVERVVRIARELGREVATPDEARKILGLPPRRKGK